MTIAVATSEHKFVFVNLYDVAPYEKELTELSKDGWSIEYVVNRGQEQAVLVMTRWVNTDSK